MRDNFDASKELEVNASLDSISSFEPLLASVVGSYFTDDSKSYFVVLSIVEILCNIIEHGYAGKPVTDDVIRVKVFSSISGVSVRVIDSSAKLPAETVHHLTSGKSEMPSVQHAVEDLPVSGWGLNIITHTASQITYQRLDDTNVLTLGFDSDHPTAVEMSM